MRVIKHACGCVEFLLNSELIDTLKLNIINETKLTNQNISDIAFDFENAIIDVLIHKTLKASQEFNIKNIVIVGGVSANKKLRFRFQNEKSNNTNIFFPDIAFSTDNGAMIAYMGWVKSKDNIVNSLDIKPDPTSKII